MLCQLGNTGTRLVQNEFGLSRLWGKNIADDFSHASFGDPIPVLGSDKKKIWTNSYNHSFL